MNTHVVFITAGEWPAQKGLLVSQVLETARALQSRGYTVSWLAAIPLLSRFKRFVLRDHDLQWLQSECQRSDIVFESCIIPVTLGSPWSMLLRRWWHKRVAQYALRRPVCAEVDGTRDIILHARSYDAAEIGICLRKMMRALNQSVQAACSFDMRSLLAPEVPMVHGIAGRLTYGFLKEFEFQLVRDSDVTFLPVDMARRHYYDETGLTIQHAPIQGLKREPSWKVDFERRWDERRLGYAGSIGRWNDPGLLVQMLNLFQDFKPDLATQSIDILSGMDCKLYKQSEMAGYYDRMLALVIPGLIWNDGYFGLLKMRCNFFSTKAAEALSRGVPLIVSSELAELAEFVRSHDCGIVLELRNGRPLLPAGLNVTSKDLWLRLTTNAASVGASFERQTVVGVYERAWQAAIERQRYTKADPSRAE